MEFTDKIVLVAGGAGGLGRAVALAFLNGGAKVAVTDRNISEFDKLRQAAGSNAGRLATHDVDILDQNAVQQFVGQLVADNGRLDVLVNTVGGYIGGKKLWELESAEFDRMLALNVRSGFVLAHAVAPAMLKQGNGAIVNIAAKAALDHAAGASAYAASKAAALAMMDSLAADLKGTGVRVNSILPSIIDTEPNRRAMPGADFSTWPKPEQIARVILFLCRDDAAVIHGAAIPVYGNS